MTAPLPHHPALELHRLVAQGGQGELWCGRWQGADVAVKVVPRGPRLEAEWEGLRSLRHVSIVRAFERLDLDAGRAALVLAWIEGRPLHEAVADARWTPTHAEHVARHLLAALAYVHAQGVVHRDVKPANVLVDDRFFLHPENPAFVVLVDFGIAAPVEHRVPITELGAVAGTPAYLPPEVLLEVGTPLDARRDVFAWAVVTWELFAGCHPAGRPGPGAGSGLFYARAFDRIRAGHQPFPVGQVPARFDPLLRASLAIDPRARPENAGAALAIIEGRASLPSSAMAAGAPTVTLAPLGEPTERQKPARWSRVGWALAVVCLLGAVGVGGAALLPRDSPPEIATPVPPPPSGRCALRKGTAVDPPRRERSSQLRTGAGQEEALIALLPRGTVVDLQTSSPSVAQREIWYRVRVVCTEDGSSEGKEGFLHAVALPGLLPIGRLRGPTDFRLRGGHDADRHATLAKGTRVAILTVGEAGGRAVRVLDGAEANQSGWIEDAKAIEP